MPRIGLVHSHLVQASAQSLRVASSGRLGSHLCRNTLDPDGKVCQRYTNAVACFSAYIMKYILWSIFFLLWVLVQSPASPADPIPQTYLNQPINTSVYGNHTLAPYTGTDQFIVIKYEPCLTSKMYSYVQVVNVTTPAFIMTYSNMGNQYFDRSGFAMMSSQLIVLPTSEFQNNMSLLVMIVDPQLSTNQWLYNLSVQTSNTIPCPNDCSNKGSCVLGQCQCYQDYYGYDCSIRPYIGQSSGKQLYYLAVYLESTYVQIPKKAFTSQLTLSIKLASTASNCLLRSYLKVGMANGQLVSPYSYTIKDTLSGSLSGFNIILPEYESDYWLVFFNEGPMTCQVVIQLTPDSSIGVLLIVLIVVGVAIVIALVFGIIFMIKKRRSRNARVTSENPTVPNALTNEQIDRYFPVVQASKVCSIASVEKIETSNDLVPTKDCVICLCPIEQKDQIRITYCNHLFHKDCLSGWFAKTQNCPYCRQSFDKPNTVQLYESVLKNCRKKSSRTVELRGQALAMQVYKYQSSKSMLIQNTVESNDKGDSSMMNIEDFS